MKHSCTSAKPTLLSASLLLFTALLYAPIQPATADPVAVPAVDPVSETDARPPARVDSPAGGEPEVTMEPPGAQEVSRKDVPWLGVSTTEASDTIAAQLNLEPGVGLVVSYVASNSPAAKAGVVRNDVLVEFDNQPLVHPAQLRKLVRVHKQEEPVKLGFYHGGKKQTVSLTLGTTRMSADLMQEQTQALQSRLQELHKQMKDLHLEDAVRDQMRSLHDSLGNLRIDQEELQKNVRQGMEQARKAVQDAIRDVTNAEPLRNVLENLAHSKMLVDEKANVVVRSSGKNVKSVVKSDEAGTLVLIRNPRLYLTAHDKDGKLLFDGPIETDEERAKVPAPVWDRVEPLLEEMRPQAETPEPKPGP